MNRLEPGGPAEDMAIPFNNLQIQNVTLGSTETSNMSNKSCHQLHSSDVFEAQLDQVNNQQIQIVDRVYQVPTQSKGKFVNNP